MTLTGWNVFTQKDGNAPLLTGLSSTTKPAAPPDKWLLFETDTGKGYYSSGGAWILATSGGGGTVTAVTASAPLASSGGTTPDISLTVPSDATKFLDGTGTFDTVKDSDLSTSNITTNNVTIAKHGFAPILPNDATKYLDGTGAYTVPAGVSTGDVVGPASAVADDIAVFNGTTGKIIKDGAKKISDLVLANGSITGATKTKITYDAKGLVTAGADAVLADLGATTADFSMNSHKLTNVTDPASAQDAATKAYVDAVKVFGVEYSIDGGGATITTGIKGPGIEFPFACTINRVTMLADQSGSIVVDIWKDTYANYPPTGADSITASAKPTITTAVKSQDATLTGWTTSIAAGDILRFNVDSVTTIQSLTVALKLTRT